MTAAPRSGSISVYRETPARRDTLLTLDATGIVTAFNGHVDLGTGIQTALAQIVAEELDLPVDRVRLVLGDTARTPDQGPTIASETIQIAAVPLRLAAAQLRAELAIRASLRLNAPVEEIALRDGRVRHAGTELDYADLLDDEAAFLTLDLQAVVKDPRAYSIVGRSVPRVDLPAKVTGTHPYIHDVDVADMVHGHVIRPPYEGRDSGDFIGRSLIGYDLAAVEAMDGFIAVVREGDFLGVVAQRADQAQRIAEALPVDWHLPPDLPDLTNLAETIRAQPSTPRRLDETGDFSAGISQCDKRLVRTYLWPYQLHGSIGPSCAIAHWQGESAIVWSGSQNPHMLRGDLATLCGLKPERIEVRRYQAAGCYGRNCADDVCGDALILSRAVGRSVRVQLTRAQEHLWEPRGAAQVMDVEGGLKDGRFHAYSLDTWYPSNRGPNLALLLTGRITPEPRPTDMGDRTIIPPYRIAHKAITVHDMAPIVRASWMRGVSALPNTFAHESFIDELAAEAGEDPVIFRLRHIDDENTADLIRQTAEKGGWEERTGPRRRRDGRMAYGQGFAFATYVHGTFPGTAAAAAAWVCDVTVDLDSGEVNLTRVFVGQDQGLVINPDGVRHQIHGNVNQTASRVLTEMVTFDEITRTGSPQSWANYPIQTFPETPRIETMLVERPGDVALGVGESAAVPSAAAIANAIFDATGIRLREVPFTPESLRRALQEEKGPSAISDAHAGSAAAKTKGWRERIGSRGLAAAAALCGTLTVAAVGLPIHRSIPPTPAPGASSFSSELLERGRQVFATGNCADCHTAAGGAANAGGLPVETPFGTIYTTNITPDPETGLGRWSFTAFERAMREGISRDGTNLYPAFPYTSFARMEGEDLFALYAYLQTLEPVRQEVQPSRLVFPTNLRPVNALWNMMFHDTTPLQPDPAKGEAWNRGRILVETTGHCSACHTPRNALGAERGGEAALSGATVKGWYAPPIAGEGASTFGWNEERYFQYLRTGFAKGLGAASGPMADVVDNLQALPDADISAMATYLASLTPLATSDPAAEPASARSMPAPDATHRLFETACAVCHEPAVADLATAARIPLSRSPAVRAASPEPVRSAIREGIKAPLSLSTRDMPAFTSELTERQIDELADYVRARYGTSK